MADLIERGAVVEALRRRFKDGFCGDAWWNSSMVLWAISEVHPARPEPMWIPVTERLPEKNEEVLVSVAGEIMIAWLHIDGIWRSCDCPDTYLNKYITAWMTLPKAYKGGNNGETD